MSEYKIVETGFDICLVVDGRTMLEADGGEEGMVVFFNLIAAEHNAIEKVKHILTNLLNEHSPAEGVSYQTILDELYSAAMVVSSGREYCDSDDYEVLGNALAKLKEARGR